MLSYGINGPFVAVSLGERYALPELRTLLESVRDNPALPARALLLFDSHARTIVHSVDAVRARLVPSSTSSIRVWPVSGGVVSDRLAGGDGTARRIDIQAEFGHTLAATNGHSGRLWTQYCIRNLIVAP
jgi:hypothetical protein